jgi:hypothetical protein
VSQNTIYFPFKTTIFRINKGLVGIRCATSAVIPTELEEKSMQGINAMIQVIQSDNFSRDDDEQLD